MKRTSLAWGITGAGLCSLGIAQGCSGDAADKFVASPAASGAGGMAGSATTGGSQSEGGAVIDTPAASGAGGEDSVPVGMGGAGGADSVEEAGGAGGQAPTCDDTDGDQDGQSECEGDCDDMNPQNYVGSPELCGDLADNNCDASADEAALCGGIGTFVSSLTGSDVTGTGTTANPVATIGKGLLNAQAILQTATGALTSIDVYVAEGSYPENVSLVEGIDLLGGFACAAQPCTWTRDPSTYVSAIQNQRFQGVIASHNVTRSTRFDGFQVTGLTGKPAGFPPGTVGITLVGATPTITNNTVIAGNSLGGGYSDGRSIGIAILAPSNDTQGALIDSNKITAGKAATAASVGILMDTTSSSPGKTYAVVTRNTIQAGEGYSSYGVLNWNSGTGTIFRNNDIFSGVAKGDSNGNAFGVAGAGTFLLDANRINVNPTLPQSCESITQWCGGVRSISATATITNNVIFGTASVLSAGVLLNELETPAGTVVLNSNHLDGGGVANAQGSISAAITMSIGGCCGNQTWVGRIMNNLLSGGKSSTRFGVYEYATDGRQAHPEALRNNDFFVPNLGAADALYRFFNGSVATRHTTIAAVNGLSAVIGPVSGNIDADCLVDASFQLPTGSLCIDAGTATDAPAFDSQGNPRPAGMGFDIGADEAE